jgi:hypothetical protein
MCITERLCAFVKYPVPASRAAVRSVTLFGYVSSAEALFDLSTVILNKPVDNRVDKRRHTHQKPEQHSLRRTFHAVHQAE